ncbi:MAG: MMPL family transporter, partial [Bacteroidota bacterium]
MMLSRRQSVLLLLLLLVLSGGLGLGLGHLQYDYDVERLFPASDEELQFFQGFRERFENENDYLALAIFRAEGIFDQAFLEEVDSLGKLLRRQPHILDASSLANASFRKLNALGLGKSSPLIHIEQPKLYAQDSAFLLSVPHFRHNLLSEDARSLCLYLKIEKGLSTELADELLMNIRLLVGEFSFERVYYSGGLYTQRSQTQLVQQEMYWLGGGAVVMVFFFLLWVFRTWWGIVLPLLVVGLAVIWTLGIMGWVGAEINVMTVLIPSILMVVGVSDVVHLLNRYLEELRLQKEQAEALYLAWKEVGLATFLTSLTTALGFLTLLGTDIAPYQQLGGFAALGVMIAYVLTFSLLPALLLLLPRPRARAFFRQSKVWKRALHTSLRIVLRYRKSIALASLGLLLLTGVGLQRVQVQAYIAEELTPDHPLQEDIQFFEANYGGVRPFTMSLQAGDSVNSVLEIKVLREMDRLETYLREQYGVRRIYSLNGNLKAANSSLHKGIARFYRLPSSDRSLSTLVEQLRFFGKD